MKIGIISDTHNNIEMTQRAVDIFKKNNIDLLIHAGDLTSPRMLGLLKGFKCTIVLGNGDIDVEALNMESERFGFGSIKKSYSFEVEGKRFIVFHGDEVPIFREAVASGNYDYIIKGHTHFFENYVSNNARIINPGSLFESDECSVAILDTETGKVRMIRIEDE